MLQSARRLVSALNASVLSNSQPLLGTLQRSQGWLCACRAFSGSSVVNEKNSSKARGKGANSYEPPSPYRQPGPRRYGFETKIFTGGVLPRPTSDHAPPVRLPTYKPKNSWSKERALFGQNDYIDILGEGSIHPVDLIQGPRWLVGFKGNELQRLVRRLRFQGPRIRALYPTKFHNIRKRIFFLHKKYNHGRRH